MGIKQKCGERNFSNSKLCPLSNAITCVDQSLAVKNTVASCLTSILDLSNLKMKIQHAKNLLKLSSFEVSYTTFSTGQQEPVA